MKRTQELFEKIEGYLAKKLSQEELSAFEKEMAADPELKREVEKHRELHNVMSDKGTLEFKEKLQKISEEIKKEQSKSNVYYSYWKIAASIIIILGVGTLLWSSLIKTNDLSDIYATYYNPYPTEDITRGDSANKLNNILKNYSEGKYDLVITELSESSSVSASEQLRLYLGNSYLNTGKEQKALLEFQSVPKSSKYYEDASWYNALTYLKMGKKKKSLEALNVIVQFNGIYKEKALQLIEKLKD